jgi:hypothetical protein
MPKKIHIIKLTPVERSELETLVRRGKVAGWMILRAQARLKCDQGEQGPAWIDQDIADAFGCTRQSVENWRKQAVEEGPLSLLERQPRPPPTAPKLVGEARLMAMACSKPPQGRARWTLQTLADPGLLLLTQRRPRRLGHLRINHFLSPSHMRSPLESRIPRGTACRLLEAVSIIGGTPHPSRRSLLSLLRDAA